MLTSRIVKFLSIAALVVGFSTIAHAQATRTWVSGVGDDANPCSRTAPCKTFAGAISKTATGGEINVLDPGGFGGVTITKAISIISECIEAGVLVSGTNAIIVNPPAGSKVLLQGLDIEGLGTGLQAVHIISAAKVTVQRCSIRNFTLNAVNIAGPAGTRTLVTECHIYGNTGGVNVGSAGVANVGLVMGTVMDNNSSFNTQIANTSTLFIGSSRLLGSPNAFTIAAGGTVSSFGDNSLQGAGLPTTTPGNH
jgi:hypothetical protein